MVPTIFADQQRLSLAVDPDEEDFVMDNAHQQARGLPGVSILKLAVARNEGFVEAVSQAAHCVCDRPVRLEEC